MGKTYRPLHHLNGDFLSKLKKPLCSEFSTNVQGKLNARNEEHRKRVELMFKDRNIVINRVKRSQDAVYKTLLRVHKQRKLLERDQYKKHQESLRLGFESRSQNSDSDITQQANNGHEYKTLDNSANTAAKKQTECLEPVTEPPSKQEHPARVANHNPSSIHNENDTQTHEHKPPGKDSKIVPKSRVLEVRKDAKESPIVRERSFVDETTANRQLAEAFPNISDIVFPAPKMKLAESTASTHDRKTYQLPALKKTPSVTKPPPPKSYLKDVQEQGMASISEEHSPRSHVGSHKAHKLSYNSSDTPGEASSGVPNIELSRSLVKSWPSVGSPRHAGSSHSSSTKLSQLQLNKRRAAEKEAMLREILAKEPVIEYVQNSKGHVVPDIKGFHRKSFEPPSLREKHQQSKLLRSEVDATIKQRERIHSFFGKMELEDEEKAEYRRRQLAKMAAEHAAHEEAEREAKRNLENLGTTLSQLIAAFNRPAALAEGVAPDSMEALQICKYVRRYEPLAMTEEQRKEARTNRISSWDHVTHS